MKSILLVLSAILSASCSQNSSLSSNIQYKEIIKDCNIENLDFIYYINNSRHLKALDSVACISDADLTEQIASTCVSLYKENKIYFFKSIYNQKLHCLENSFVLGMSEELSVFQGTDRAKRVHEIKKEVLSVSNGLTEDEKRNSIILINKISPEIFD